MLSPNQVGSIGFLLISGQAEPVVRAYSLIADLIERYEGIQSRRGDIGDRGSGESLDSRRAFKILVEKWDDRHILDLLVLPGSVKEILLDLVKESGLGSTPRMEPSTRSNGNSEGRWDSTSHQWIEGMSAGAGRDSAIKDHMTACSGGRPEGAEEGLAHSPQELGDKDQLGQVTALDTNVTGGRGEEDEQELQFLLLLKFFTAMGYAEDVVKQVLARTGPKEASQILDLVQQEQDRSDLEQINLKTQTVTLNEKERNRPCESEHKEDGEVGAGGETAKHVVGAKGITRHPEGDGGATGKEEENEEDFVLGVLKKAAASCGYMERKVTEVYNMLPNRSTHQLLLELQRDETDADTFREGPREMDDMVLERAAPKVEPAEDETRGEVQTFIPAENRDPVDEGQIALPKKTLSVAQPDFFDWTDEPDLFTANHNNSQSKQHQPPKSQTPHQIVLPEVKGPPMATYSSSIDPPHTNLQPNHQHSQTSYWPNHSTSQQNQPTEENMVNTKLQSSTSLKQAFQAPQPPVITRKESSSTRAKEKRGFTPTSSVVVTGEQRFLDGLKVPFDLQLTDKPGDTRLRTIIIDGSNVAMRWEYCKYFVCVYFMFYSVYCFVRGGCCLSSLQVRGQIKLRTSHQSITGLYILKSLLQTADVCSRGLTDSVRIPRIRIS